MFVFVVLTEIVDKEKSQELAKIPGIQLPDNFATLDFNTVIRKSRAFVNPPAEKNQKSDLADGTERNRRGRKRLRREKRKELRSDTEKAEHGFGCHRGGARQQKEGEQRKAFVVGKKQGEAERRRADEDACGKAPEPLGEGRGRMFYRVCDRQEECRSREKPRGHGIIVRGKYGEREERGQPRTGRSIARRKSCGIRAPRGARSRRRWRSPPARPWGGARRSKRGST